MTKPLKKAPLKKVAAKKPEVVTRPAHVQLAVAFVTQPDGREQMRSIGGMYLFPVNNADAARRILLDGNPNLKPEDITIYVGTFTELMA